MVNKLGLIITLTFFWLFVPFAMMYLNLSGYDNVDSSFLNTISSDDFSLLSFKGLGFMFKHMIALSKFTISNIHPLLTTFFIGLGIISIAVLYLLVRGN